MRLLILSQCDWMPALAPKIVRLLMLCLISHTQGVSAVLIVNRGRDGCKAHLASWCFCHQSSNVVGSIFL